MQPRTRHNRPELTPSYLHAGGCRSRRAAVGQSGFSSLETTIIFIAFVTLAAVFGFSVLSTGVLTSESSKEAILQGLGSVSGALFQSGAVIGQADESLAVVDLIKFQLTNAAKVSEGVNLAPDVTGGSYFDDVQVSRLSPEMWTATWLSGFGSLINPGERVEIALDLTALSPRLGPSQEFYIELVTGGGATLRVRRVTPPSLAAFFDLP